MVEMGGKIQYWKEMVNQYAERSYEEVLTDSQDEMDHGV